MARCARCGGVARRGRCADCEPGADLGPLDVVVTLEPELTTSPDETASAGPPSRRGLLGVAAVAVLLVGAVVVGRATDHGEASAPTTAAAPSTVATSVAPVTTASPRGRRDPFAGKPSTASLDPLTGSVVAPGLLPRWFQTTFDASLTGLPTGGTILYALSVDGRLVRLDLDAGTVTERLLRSPTGSSPPAGAQVIARRGAALVVTGPRDLLLVADGPTGTIRWEGGFGKVVPAAEAGELWRVLGDETGDRMAQRVDLNLDPAGPPWALPPSSNVLFDDGAGGLVLDGPGGPQRRSAPDLPGTELDLDGLLASSNGIVVSAGCPFPHRCQWQAQSAGGSKSGVLPPELARPGPLAALAADGHHLARITADGSTTTLVVLDLGTGRSQTIAGDFAGGVTPVWSASGDLVFVLSRSGSIVVVDALTGETLPLDVAGLPPLVALSGIGAG